MATQLDTRPAVRKPGTLDSELYSIHAGAYSESAERLRTGVTDLHCRTCTMLIGVVTRGGPENRFVRGAVSLEPIYVERGTGFFEAAKKPPRGQRGTMPDERLTLRLANFFDGEVSRGVTIVQLYQLPIRVKCRHCGCINEVTEN